MNDGNVKRKTQNQRAAMRRSTEARRCPKCKRSGALGAVQRDALMSVRKCRYCGHERGIIAGKLFGYEVSP